MIAFLRFAAIIPLLVGALHMAMGPGADALLGAQISPETLADPSLDSQNRFYGAAFTLYGVLLWLCASNLKRYAPVLRLLLACFFIGGVARGISWMATDWPAPAIIALWAVELILPPILILWLRRTHLQG
jgi:hypothetical protein